MEGLWPIITVVGPILLVIVLIWAVVRNRYARADIARTERAARELREDIDRHAEH